MNNQIVTDPTKKVKYIKPSVERLHLSPASPDGYIGEVARVAAVAPDDRLVRYFAVVNAPRLPAGMFCECRHLIHQLDAAPCVHIVAVKLAGDDVKPLPL